jgi:hypothetical protein
MIANLNVVPFVSVDHMMQLVLQVGVERFLRELAGYIEADFRRWPAFDKTPRIASHSAEGVIELMPTSDGNVYGFKYVNGHPKNTRDGRQTVTAFGVLADVGTGYPMLLSEMTILTALRTAATSASRRNTSRRRRAYDGDHRQRRAVRIPGAGFQGAARRRPASGSTTSTVRPLGNAPKSFRHRVSTSPSADRRRRRSKAPTSSPP